jgi:hypothetical protein
MCQQPMKQILLILIILISISANAEPLDKLVQEITSTQTLTELKIAKTKFYSRHNRTPLTRNMNFSYEHTLWEFEYVHGNYSTDFRLFVITRNDSIIFGRLEQLHWRGRTEKTYNFSINNNKLEDLVNHHNNFYLTSYSINKFIDDITQDYYFSLGCGETASYRPKEANKMIRWVESNNIKKLSNWLRSPNYELQAYGIEGLIRIKENGKPIPENLEKIIKYLRDRNNVVVNCAGCLMGLVTPINKLIFEYRRK